jgi:membrane-associated protease RseP (regulator of RpoE activity)
VSDTPSPTVTYDSLSTPLPLRGFSRNRVWLHVGLFVLALVTTTLVGAEHYAAFVSDFGRRVVDLDPALLLDGLWYSLTIVAILGAHEMGHYLACRYYAVDASLPYFLPLPFGPTGTLGAVIRIRQRFPSRRILFDIGIMGPLAGFALIVPALFLGLHLSTVTANPTIPTETLGEPLLFQWAAQATFGSVPDGYTLNIHPMVFAAWFGMLATALNLLPFGQLDGGHITYAVFGRKSRAISIGTFAAAVLMTFFVSVAIWGMLVVLMAVMVRLVGMDHPPPVDEIEPLGRGRIVMAVLALIVFVVCATPTPMGLPSLRTLFAAVRGAIGG